MSIPTTGEEFSKLVEHLRLAREAASMLGHLVRDDKPLEAKGWRVVAEGLKLMEQNVIALAKGRRQ